MDSWWVDSLADVRVCKSDSGGDTNKQLNAPFFLNNRIQFNLFCEFAGEVFFQGLLPDKLMRYIYILFKWKGVGQNPFQYVLI